MSFIEKKLIQAKINGGGRILSTQGNTADNPAIGFLGHHETPITAGQVPNLDNENNDALFKKYSNDGGGGNGIFRPLANTMAFATCSTERMRITSVGSVGIAVVNPTAVFHTKGTVRHEALPTKNEYILSIDKDGNLYRTKYKVDRLVKTVASQQAQINYLLNELSTLRNFVVECCNKPFVASQATVPTATNFVEE